MHSGWQISVTEATVGSKDKKLQGNFLKASKKVVLTAKIEYKAESEMLPKSSKVTHSANIQASNSAYGKWMSHEQFYEWQMVTMLIETKAKVFIAYKWGEKMEASNCVGEINSASNHPR